MRRISAPTRQAALPITLDAAYRTAAGSSARPRSCASRWPVGLEIHPSSRIGFAILLETTRRPEGSDRRDLALSLGVLAPWRLIPLALVQTGHLHSGRVL